MKFQTKIILGIIGFFLGSYSLQAQTETAPLKSYQSSFTFEGDKFKEDVSLIITAESTYLRLNVDGKIKDGEASAILYTKHGRKICGLGLKARNGNRAKGNMGEELEVREGIYILKIRCDGGQGFLNVDFSQH